MPSKDSEDEVTEIPGEPPFLKVSTIVVSYNFTLFKETYQESTLGHDSFMEDQRRTSWVLTGDHQTFWTTSGLKWYQ